MTLFAGNSKLLLIKKQTDKDTPITDFSVARAFRVFNLSKDPARVVTKLQETDASTMDPDSRVTAIGPAITFDAYGKPDELDFLSEAVLGENTDSATVSPNTHHASPSTDMPYYSILEVNPYATVGPRWDGCRCDGFQLQSQDEGSTELQLTGIAWMAMGLTHGVAVPGSLPTPDPNAPFIHAELAASYAGVHLGTTKQVQAKISRNLSRAQGDNGFTALDIVPGLIQFDGQMSRYTQDDTLLRAVDTGTDTGTAITTTIKEIALSILYSRGSGGSAMSWLVTSPNVAELTRDEALQLDGKPYVEVMGFEARRSAGFASYVTAVTVNDKATTA